MAVPPAPPLPDRVASRYETTAPAYGRLAINYYDRRAVVVSGRQRAKRRLTQCQFARVHRRMRSVLPAPAFHVFAPDRRFRHLQTRVNGRQRSLTASETRDPFGSPLGAPSPEQWATLRFLDAFLAALIQGRPIRGLGCSGG